MGTLKSAEKNLVFTNFKDREPPYTHPDCRTEDSGLTSSLGRLSIFSAQSGHPETILQIHKAWNNTRIAAGLPDVRMHDLRHSMASNMVNSGRSIYEVAKVLGHSQLKTTQRYAHSFPGDLAGSRGCGSQSNRYRLGLGHD